jgi:hypothetical protein
LSVIKIYIKGGTRLNGLPVTSSNAKNLTGRAPFFLVLFQLKSTLATQPRRSSKEKVRSIKIKFKIELFNTP